jgi:hypothetical protein
MRWCPASTTKSLPVVGSIAASAVTAVTDAEAVVGEFVVKFGWPMTTSAGWLDTKSAADAGGVGPVRRASAARAGRDVFIKIIVFG